MGTFIGIGAIENLGSFEIDRPRATSEAHWYRRHRDHEEFRSFNRIRDYIIAHLLIGAEPTLVDLTSDGAVTTQSSRGDVIT